MLCDFIPAKEGRLVSSNASVAVLPIPTVNVRKDDGSAVGTPAARNPERMRVAGISGECYFIFARNIGEANAVSSAYASELLSDYTYTVQAGQWFEDIIPPWATHIGMKAGTGLSSQMKVAFSSMAG